MNNQLLRRLLLWMSLLPAVLLAGAANADFIPVENVTVTQQTVTLNGITRPVVTLKPTTAGTTGKAPIWFLLDYRDGALLDFADLAQIGQLVRDLGIWVVLPQSGTGGMWNWKDSSSGDDDVGFLSSLIGQYVANDPIDPTRVFMVGYSDGGGMTELMACKQPQLIAGGAIVAAKLTTSLKDDCKPTVGTPMLFFAGTADLDSLYNAGIGELSVPATAAFWAGTAGCSTTPTTTDLPNTTDDNTTTTIQLNTYGGCNSYGGVSLYTVVNGGHTWPGALDYSPLLGVTTQQINATTLMKQFFSSLSR